MMVLLCGARARSVAVHGAVFMAEHAWVWPARPRRAAGLAGSGPVARAPRRAWYAHTLRSIARLTVVVVLIV